jgi:hypothetical protein
MPSTPSASRPLALLAWGAALIGAFWAWFPIADTDLWWHLAAGRELWEQGRWLAQDPFCSSTLGLPWLNIHWLFQLCAYALYSAGGPLASSSPSSPSPPSPCASSWDQA